MTLNKAFQQQVDQAALAIETEAQDHPVIVVYGLGSYGDLIQITPLLRALKSKFPAAALLLVHHDPLGARLIESAPYLTRFIRLRSNLHYLLRTRLQDEVCDLTVECRYVIKYNLSRCPRLSQKDIAFVTNAQEVQKSWLPLVQNFPHDNDLLWRAAAARGWSMYDLMAQTSGFGGEDFETLCINLPEDATVPPKFSFPVEYIVVSNSAEWLPLQSSLWTKSLPHERLQEVVATLEKSGHATVLLGTANDPGDYAVRHDLRGKTNLLEAAAIVRGARLLIGPEGGLVNLAKAVGTPAVVFFGSTPPEFFSFKSNANIVPRICGGCWWSTESYLRHCPLLEEIPPCTNSISTADVMAAAEGLLAIAP